MLFFLSFTFGYVVQSAILPIAIGSLRGGIGFLVYTFVISFYVMGHGAELDLLRFKTINLGEVWYVVIFWYFIELFLNSNKKVRIKNKKR